MEIVLLFLSVFGSVVFIILLFLYSLRFKRSNARRNKLFLFQNSYKSIVFFDEISAVEQNNESKRMYDNPLCVII